MPVRVDELCAKSNTDAGIGSDSKPSAVEKTPPGFVGETTPLEFPAFATASSLADAFGGTRISFDDDIGTTFTNIGARLNTTVDVVRTLYSQVEGQSAFGNPAVAVSEHLTAAAAMQTSTLAHVSILGLARPSPLLEMVEHSPSVMSSLLGSVSEALVMPSLGACFPTTTVAESLPGLALTQAIAAATQAVLHDFAFPLSSAMQQLGSAFQSSWDLAVMPWLGSSVLDRVNELIFPFGTVHGDLLVLVLPAADPLDREKALHRVADRIPWNVKRNPWVWRAVVTRAKAERTSVRAIVHRELCTAVFLVMESRDEPQTLRLGREWVTDDDGRKIAFPPHELPAREFWRWLCTRSIAMAEATVLGQPFPTTDILDRQSRDREPAAVLWLDADQDHAGVAPLNDLLVDEADPLLLLLMQQEQEENAARLLAALEVATPRQRELLSLIGAGLSEAEAARRLGLAPATARTQLHRLRQKIV